MILPRQTKNEKPFQRFWKGLQVDAGLNPGSPTHVVALGVDYPRLTLAAWKPFGPFSKSNSTVSPSLRVR